MDTGCQTAFNCRAPPEYITTKKIGLGLRDIGFFLIRQSFVIPIVYSAIIANCSPARAVRSLARPFNQT
jgi:hypothetical protein